MFGFVGVVGAVATDELDFFLLHATFTESVAANNISINVLMVSPLKILKVTLIQYSRIVPAFPCKKGSVEGVWD